MWMPNECARVRRPIPLLGGAAARADSPAGGTLVAAVPVSTPRDVSGGFGSIWVSNAPTRTVARIDTGSDMVLAAMTTPR